MSFNFGALATQQPTNNVNYLKPYTINENVSIKSTEVRTGTNKEGNPWKSLTITFGNDEGIFNHTMFYPDEKNVEDTTRKTVDMKNGGKREVPSRIEELMNQIAAIGFEFFSEDFVKLQSVVAKITTVEQLMEYFKKFVDKNVDKVQTNMKLVGRNSEGKVYATFPKFTGIAYADNDKKAIANGVEVGQWYTWRISPFGKNVAFTPYENTQANTVATAKPTEMPEAPVESDDIDFNSLL